MLPIVDKADVVVDDDVVDTSGHSHIVVAAANAGIASKASNATTAKREATNTTTTKRKRSTSTKATPAKSDAMPLLDLGPLEEGVLVCRPSERNRSAYVGDVRITLGPHAGCVAVTHIPNMDSGGKCRPGT